MMGKISNVKNLVFLTCAFLLAAGFVLFAPTEASATEFRMWVDVNPAQVNPGEQVTVTTNIIGAHRVGGWEYTLQFPNFVTTQPTRVNGVYPNDNMQSRWDTGEFTFAAGYNNQAWEEVNLNGVLTTYTFTVPVGTAHGNYNFTMRDVVAENMDDHFWYDFETLAPVVLRVGEPTGSDDFRMWVDVNPAQVNPGEQVTVTTNIIGAHRVGGWEYTLQFPNFVTTQPTRVNGVYPNDNMQSRWDTGEFTFAAGYNNQAWEEVNLNGILTTYTFTVPVGTQSGSYDFTMRDVVAENMDDHFWYDFETLPPVTLTVLGGGPSMSLSGTGTFPTIMSGAALPPAQTFTITNTGTGALTGLAHNAPTGFTVAGLPASLAEGTNATFTVVPSATAVGTHTASLVINSGDTSTNAIALSFTVTAAEPRIEFMGSPDGNFGTAQTNALPAARTLTIRNAGNTTLTGLTANITGNFEISSGLPLPASLGAGLTHTIQVRPTRTTVGGPDTGTLTVSANSGADTVTTQSVALSFTAIAVPGGLALNISTAPGGISRLVTVTASNNSASAVAAGTAVVIFAEVTDGSSASPPNAFIWNLGAVAAGGVSNPLTGLSVSGAVRLTAFWLSELPATVLTTQHFHDLQIAYRESNAS